MYHYWEYKNPRSWKCANCGGTTDNPNAGPAAQPNCPGSKRRKK